MSKGVEERLEQFSSCWEDEEPELWTIHVHQIEASRIPACSETPQDYCTGCYVHDTEGYRKDRR